MIAQIWEANFKIREIYDSIVAGQKEYRTKEFAPGYFGRSILPQEGSVYTHWESQNLLASEFAGRNSKDPSTVPLLTPELIEVHNIVASKGLNPTWLRLGILRPGGMLPWHVDGSLDKPYFRLHIPLITNPQSYFETETEREHFEANGNAYLIKVNCVHRVYNQGESERWHLIMDVAETADLTKLF